MPWSGQRLDTFPTRLTCSSFSNAGGAAAACHGAGSDWTHFQLVSRAHHSQTQEELRQRAMERAAARAEAAHSLSQQELLIQQQQAGGADAAANSRRLQAMGAVCLGPAPGVTATDTQGFGGGRAGLGGSEGGVERYSGRVGDGVAGMGGNEEGAGQVRSWQQEAEALAGEAGSRGNGAGVCVYVCVCVCACVCVRVCFCMCVSVYMCRWALNFVRIWSLWSLDCCLGQVSRSGGLLLNTSVQEWLRRQGGHVHSVVCGGTCRS